MKKLWIDDVRDPGEGWVWKKTWAESLGEIATHIDSYQVISFDHDLGNEYHDGYDLLTFIENWVNQGLVRRLPKLEVHSANPVGYARMMSAIDAIYSMYTGDQPYAPMRVTKGMDFEPPFFMEPH